MSRMHRHEWPTEVLHSQLLNGLAKKKLLSFTLTVSAPDDCRFATVVMILHVLYASPMSV